MDMRVNSKTKTTDFLNLADEIGPDFAKRAAANNENDDFVYDNVDDLKRHKFYSAMVPAELGGGGVSHSKMCAVIRKIGRYCPSTALTFSMHQHLIAANRWNYQKGNPGQVLLEKVADKELVLVSTGAKDWLSSTGEMTRTDGGYLVSAKKGFASGSPAGDMVITSAPYQDPDDGWQVCHFPVHMSADGVSVIENWQAMGMRNTGSHLVVMEKVFVPEESIGLKRPQGKFHPMWSVVLTVAMPLIMSAYQGIADGAVEIARENSRGNTGDAHLPYLMGEMETAFTTSEVAYESMVAIANDLDFAPEVTNADNILKRKTIVSDAVKEVTAKAMELSGGPGFLRTSRLEQYFRDAQASQFHPLSEKKQHHFTGRLAMGLEPVEAKEL